jgi:hypothetical protein
MKKIFFLNLINLCFVANIQAQQNSTNRQLLDSILSLAKEHSVYSKTIKWEELSEKVIINLNLNDTTRMALVKPTQLLLKEIKDFHGAILIDGNRYGGNIKNEVGPPYPINPEISSKLYNQSLNGYKIETRMLTKKIGYIEIPAININADQEAIVLATKTIRDSICILLSKKPKKLIIDLRANIGGNLYPMLAGLGVLFPNMKLGGDSKDGETFYSNWELKDGNFYMWENEMTSIPLNCKCKNKITEYVVLTSRYTTSSGEAVASALKGQRNITLLGEQTAGYSSTNSWFQITENVLFSPAVAYYMSIDKAFHKNGIIPDIEIVEDLKVQELKTGKMIERAIVILK